MLLRLIEHPGRVINNYGGFSFYRLNPIDDVHKSVGAVQVVDNVNLVDQKSFDDSVWNAWNSCAGDFSAFAVKLDALGMSLARGNRAMLVLDDATGYSAPLVRLLRRRAKAVGSKVSLREADFTAAFSAARDFVMARDEELNRARAVAETAIDRECAKGIMEAVANADQDSAADFPKERAKRRTQDEASASGTAHLEETLKVRRDAIWAAYRERDRLRRKRVDRAFRAARIARSGAYEEVAILLAAGAALLTGMALSVALGFVALTTAAAKIARGAARLHESPSAAIAATTAQTAADLESTQAKGRKASKNRLRRSGNTVRRGSGIGE